MNYLHLHRQSNLITSVISSSTTPTSTDSSLFIPVSDRVLSTYYKLKSKTPLVDVGSLAKLSPSVFEFLLSFRK